MKNVSPQRLGLMGKLNNNMVELIDASQLTPSEVLLVLEGISERIRQLFALSITGGKK